MTAPNDRLISRSVLYTLVALVVLGIVLHALRGILAPVLLAFLLAYAFDPLVEFLARHRWPRILASVSCLLLMILVASGLVALILPVLFDEFALVVEKAPVYFQKIREAMIQNFGVELPNTLRETLEAAREHMGESAGAFAAPAATILAKIFSGLTSLISALIYIVLVPLFVFYFLKDYKRITGWFANLIPPRHREKVLGVFGEIDGVLSGFLRGQLMVAAILATLYSLAFTIAGIPAGIIIGVVTGLFNIVPYLGTVTGILLSCLFLLLEEAPWTSFAIVGSIFAGVNLLDGLFITPRVLGQRLGLVPVAVILAVLAFSEVFGFVGVLVAVPVTAIGKVLGKHAIAAYRKSRSYSGQPEEASGQDA